MPIDLFVDGRRSEDFVDFINIVNSLSISGAAAPSVASSSTCGAATSHQYCLRACMGASSSKKRNSNSNWSWTGPPGDHSPFPVNLIPYQGPELLYCFVDIMTSFQIISKFFDMFDLLRDRMVMYDKNS